MASTTSSSLPTTNKRWLLKKRPEGSIGPENFELEEAKIDSNIKDGQLLVRVIYISLDPTLMFWAVENPPYTPKIPIGDVMNALGLGQVIASKNERFKEGDFVVASVGFQEYAVIDASHLFDVARVNDDPKYPLHIAINNFGITGLTGYFALLKRGEPKEGETLLISGAAGATGLMVGAIGKIKGCRVIGIAGSDEKCKSLTEKFGFDGAINYKTDNIEEQIKKLCPKGVDIYFDNVGGELLDVVLNNLASHARIVVCGAISQYGSMTKGQSYGVKNTTSLVFKEAQMRGFFLPNYREQYGEAAKEIHQWLEEGKMKPIHVSMSKGIENVPTALKDMFDGKNIGKTIAEVSKPPAPWHD